MALIVVFTSNVALSEQKSSSKSDISENIESAFGEMEKEGLMPKNVDRGTTLAGTDDNENGIRDDLENFIISRTHTLDDRVILEEFARAHQRIQAEDILTRDVKRSVSKQLSLANFCLYERASDIYEMSENKKIVTSFIASTLDRLKRYQEFEQYGVSSDIPKDADCDSLAGYHENLDEKQAWAKKRIDQPGKFKTWAEVAVENVQEGYGPELDRSDNRSGKDLDGNGIRDDIDRFIESEKITENDKNIVREIAKGYQKIQTAEVFDMDVIQYVLKKVTADLGCLSNKASNMRAVLKMRQDIKHYTANTHERLKREWEMTKMMNGDFPDPILWCG